MVVSVDCIMKSSPLVPGSGSGCGLGWMLPALASGLQRCCKGMQAMETVE
jgi:hypothetical protein